MNKLKTNKIIGIKGSYMRMIFITFRFRSSNFFRNFEVIGSCHNIGRMKTIVFLVSSVIEKKSVEVSSNAPISISMNFGHIIGELSLMLLLDTARYCVTSPEGEMLLLPTDECLRLTLLGFFLSSPDVIKCNSSIAFLMPGLLPNFRDLTSVSMAFIWRTSIKALECLPPKNLTSYLPLFKTRITLAGQYGKPLAVEQRAVSSPESVSPSELKAGNKLEENFSVKQSQQLQLLKDNKKLEELKMTLLKLQKDEQKLTSLKDVLMKKKRNLETLLEKSLADEIKEEYVLKNKLGKGVGVCNMTQLPTDYGQCKAAIEILMRIELFYFTVNHKSDQQGNLNILCKMGYFITESMVNEVNYVKIKVNTMYEKSILIIQTFEIYNSSYPTPKI
uniref:Uncharacterized protein n=1 Tax=Glossina pallidipes TaxID=7398 RepID=A0A1A9ZKU4_GLOPL